MARNIILLTAFLSLITISRAGAGEVTFDFINESYGLTRYSVDPASYISSGTICKSGDVELYLSKTVGKKGFVLWTDGMRFYRNCSARIYVSAPGKVLKSISVNGDEGAVFTLDAVSEDTGCMLSNVWTASEDANPVEEVCLDYSGNGTYAVSGITVSFVGDGDASVPEMTDNESDDAPAEYFTLQGVRVGSAVPAKGLYICRRGHRVSKVLIR